MSLQYPLTRFLLSIFIGAASAGCSDGGREDAVPTTREEGATLAAHEGPASLEDELEPIRRAHGVPALAGAVFDEDGVLAIGATGERKLGSHVPVTVNDSWHLGSETKAMTASLFARKVERNEAKWDATVENAFPNAPIDPGFKGVTMRELLQHRGGAPGTSPSSLWAKMWEAPLDSTTTRRNVVLELLKERPETHRGAFVYSNFDYMAVGAALENEATWEEQIAKDVFTPLDMGSCGFGAAGTPLQNDEPLGHASTDHGYVAIEPSAQADNPRSFGPAGTVHCTLLDWGKFLRAHLRGANGDASYLGASSFGELHTAAPRSASDEPDYALGFYVVRRSWTNGPALTHDGTNTMNYATAWIAPGIHRVFVAVSNAGGPAAQAATDALIVKMAETYAR